MNELIYDQFSDLFKALAHPVRLQILDILRSQPACVCHINAILEQRQAYISQQLSVLKDAGVVSNEKIGWNVYYKIITPEILEAVDAIQKIVDPDFVPEEYGVIENCPCPICTPEEE